MDEGHDVLVWCGDEKDGGPKMLTSHRKVGVGIVPRTDSWETLLEWAKEGAHYGLPTVMFFDGSGLGKLADQARKAGVYTVGGGSFMDRLEKDRTFGQRIAEQAGCKLPGFMEFESIDATIAFAKTKLDRPVYWKTDTYIDADATKGADDPAELVEYLTWIRTKTRPGIKNILQEKIDGPALSIARWWNGRAWIGPYQGDWERKKFMAGEIGPSTGCSLNAVWMYDSDRPQVAEAVCWEATTAAFLTAEAPPGIYDINALLSGGEAYFLEWTPRCGWDSEGASLTALFNNLGEWLWYVATGQGDGGGWTDEIALAIRLSVPPYPSEHIERDDKASAMGVPVRGDVGDLWSDGFVAYQLQWDEETELTVACAEGIVGLACATGYSVEDLGDEIKDFAKKRLRVPGLQYRDDAAKCVAEDTEKAKKEGFTDFPEGLEL